MTTVEQRVPVTLAPVEGVGRPGWGHRPGSITAARRLRSLKDHLVAYGLLSPAIVVFTIFFYLPAIYLVYI